jgi:hypothetical protein
MSDVPPQKYRADGWIMPNIFNETARQPSLQTSKRESMRKTAMGISMLALFYLFLGTGESFGQSSSPVSAFAGDWKFSFSGGLTGDGMLRMSPDGSISIYLSLGKYQHLYTNPIFLKVSDAGALHGDIFLLSVKMGVVFGMFSSNGDLYGEVSTPFLDVGTVAGRLTQSSGNGTYQSVVGNGTWTAERN